ncbi:alpha/beta fold hydrolase [Aquirhabdus sp.]|uniref:alpha/beta fold hydrolase n=1 Tax=Aquirhabdus sp. TaxID=2824160 RepID=UPI00396CB7BB
MDSSIISTLESVYIQTRLGQIRVRTGGQGPDSILFWPSLLMDGSMWSAQATYFISRYRVILLDSPGHGESSPLHQRFTFDECAVVVTQILDALDIQHAHFVGNSWGGMIGGTFAAQYPDRIGVAVLMNATASTAGLYQKLEFLMLTRLVSIIGYIPSPLVSRAIKAFIGPTSERERPQVADSIRKSLHHINPRSVIWAIDSVVPFRPDQRLLFQSIRTPVLIVAGGEDRTFSVAETRIMAEAIPHAEFMVMPHTAHLAALECPDEVNTLINDYLQRYQS